MGFEKHLVFRGILNMKISKKVPVIVCTVILLFCIFAGYIHANSRYFLSDQRQFLYTVTLKEGVSIVDTSQAIDAFLDGKPYEPSDIDIPAGSEGYINLMYGHLQSYITDPETNTSRFQVDFYQDDKLIHACLATGPESQLRENDISYKKFGNYEEFIADYNQKVKEAKDNWDKGFWFCILRGLAVAVVLSILFIILCAVANKLKMNPAVFGILCAIYVVLVLAAVVFVIIPPNM